MILCCVCPCHVDDDGKPEPVDVRDPIGAATACSICVTGHVPALESTSLANEEEPRPYDPNAWVDPPTSDGELGG